jgi:hypothetical protein
MTAITDPEHIQQFRMLTLLAGLRLEVRGLRMKGRSCYQIVKSEFGLTGNRRQVLEQYETILNDRGIKKARPE